MFCRFVSKFLVTIKVLSMKYRTYVIKCDLTLKMLRKFINFINFERFPKRISPREFSSKGFKGMLISQKRVITSFFNDT